LTKVQNFFGVFLQGGERKKSRWSEEPVNPIPALPPGIVLPNIQSAAPPGNASLLLRHNFEIFRGEKYVQKFSRFLGHRHPFALLKMKYLRFTGHHHLFEPFLKEYVAIFKIYRLTPSFRAFSFSLFRAFRNDFFALYIPVTAIFKKILDIYRLILFRAFVSKTPLFLVAGKNPQLVQYAIRVFGSTDLTEDQWRQCEDQIKVETPFVVRLHRESFFKFIV
jgi:hypothetical protein